MAVLFDVYWNGGGKVTSVLTTLGDKSRQFQIHYKKFKADK